MNFEIAKSKFNFKKTLCGLLAVVVAFACIQPGFTAIAAYDGISVTDGNVTDGNVTGGNVTGGNVTNGNVTGGNVTDGNVDVPCEHVWTSEGCVKVDPTCTESGYEGTVCEICGIAGDNITILPVGHVSVTDEAVAPTCTETGLTEGSHCSVCDEVITAQEIVEATGHTAVTDEAVAPTCTETGLTEGSHCSVCDVVLTEQEIVEATGHTSSDWILDKEPTCGLEGSKHKECTVCKAVLETEAIEKPAHESYNWVVDVDSTCTETGLIHRECAECHTVVEQLVIAQAGHTPSGWMIQVKATVNSEGKMQKKCTTCGEVLETEVIKQLACSSPKLNKATNTADGVKITWNKVKGADSYTVYRKTGKGEWKAIKANVKNTSFVDKTAKNGVTYKYTVKAKNEAGLSKYDSALSIKFINDPVLKAPTSAKKGITLKWNKVKGVDGYVVYRQVGKGKFTKIATVKGSAKVSYLDVTAKKGKKYTYKLKAYSGKTYSAYSNAKTIKDKY